MDPSHGGDQLMNRPRTTGAHLPPRMLERRRKLKSGKVWVGYYYNAGKGKEIPLGTDLAAAKVKWAELEGKPQAADTTKLEAAFNKYLTDIVPKKSAKTQKLNEAEIETLRSYFKGASFKDVKTKHLAAYRDGRKTKKRLRKDGTVRDPGGRPAPVAANRELALFSDVWNIAREWGYTDLPNPCRGLRRNEEKPRDFYADDEVWQAVYDEGPQEFQDAMDLAYLSGQRPDDVVAVSERHIVDDGLMVRQGKTGKLLRIELTDRSDPDRPVRTELGKLIDRMRSRPIRHRLKLLYTSAGKPLTRPMLRSRFEDAREAAAVKADKVGDAELAARIRRMWFTDNRPKAASEIDDIKAASKLLGHSEEAITRKVYRRVGERAKPTR
jgi:integrase